MATSAAAAADIPVDPSSSKSPRLRFVARRTDQQHTHRPGSSRSGASRLKDTSSPHIRHSCADEPIHGSSSQPSAGSLHGLYDIGGPCTGEKPATSSPTQGSSRPSCYRRRNTCGDDAAASAAANEAVFSTASRGNTLPFSTAAAPSVPRIPQTFRPPAETALSIDEIIRQHRSGLNVPLWAAVRGSSAPPLAGCSSGNAPIRSRTITESSASSGHSRTSVDSVGKEVSHILRQKRNEQRRLHSSKSTPSLSAGNRASSSIARTPSRLSKMSQRDFTSPSPRPSISPSVCKIEDPPGSDTWKIARYLRSAKLTRLLTMHRPPNHRLVVSLADVGDPTGWPVVVFLGLGCLRYLVGLYDELAFSLGLRLICIDRWGLGKTTPVPDSKRGFLEWASVVEETLNQLQISRCSLMAHSAGAPFALAASLRLGDRVCGRIHLLAPWVIGTAGEKPTSSAYRWLRYVPSRVIKTAQSAENTLQRWKLGKPPTITPTALGFDLRAPIRSDSISPVLMSFGDDDDHDYFLGNNDAEASDLVTTPRLACEGRPAGGDDSQSTSAHSWLSEPVMPVFGGTRQGHYSMLSFSLRPGSATTPLAGRTVRLTSSQPAPTSARQLERDAADGLSASAGFASALLQASHAESLAGSSSDLLTILSRTSTPAGFKYSDVETPVQVWHGAKDDKIPLESVTALQDSMKDCNVRVIPDADHSLMTNVAVVMQVLKSIHSDGRAMAL